jgi:hypothetical protein
LFQKTAEKGVPEALSDAPWEHVFSEEGEEFANCCTVLSREF